MGEPHNNGDNFVWRLQWSTDICEDIVSWTNPKGRLTNSDLELAALVLQESCFPAVCSTHLWHVLATGSDNTPPISWTFHEASTVNPVVADLLRLRSSHNRASCLSPSVFYHPGQDNVMADDTSRRFDLIDAAFLPFFSTRYPPQSTGS